MKVFEGLDNVESLRTVFTVKLKITDLEEWNQKVPQNKYSFKIVQKMLNKWRNLNFVWGNSAVRDVYH